MKRIIIEVSENLLNRVDEAGIKDGFNSRSEFLRFLIVTYLKKEHPNVFGEPTVASGDEEDEDFSFGISPKQIEEIKRKAAILGKNRQQPLS